MLEPFPTSLFVFVPFYDPESFPRWKSKIDGQLEGREFCAKVIVTGFGRSGECLTLEFSKRFWIYLSECNSSLFRGAYSHSKLTSLTVLVYSYTVLGESIFSSVFLRIRYVKKAKTANLLNSKIK
ncbi:uncharacterized protein LOC143182043 [Calliopsis andreniformis]|uniref:uncharacterized protein LOC143182043 n=1 Tax=Calliopsis andreniformis TaxID=337506 RepID=UPI003FCC4B5A